MTCGLLTVPENRASPTGRTIKVAVGIVHAQSPQPGVEPIVFVDGGPSFDAISPFALGSYFAGASYIQRRDVILVDTRGTGLSEPRLGCPELDQAGTESVYAGRFVESMRVELITAALASCRDRLSAAGIDLAAYNSAESAADLDDIRRALGYDRWNLVAISADGVLGLTYMRLFPDGIRSAIIDSGQSTQMLEPLDYARGDTEVLERVFAGCAANAGCSRVSRHPHRVLRPRPPAAGTAGDRGDPGLRAAARQGSDRRCVVLHRRPLRPLPR